MDDNWFYVTRAYGKEHELDQLMDKFKDYRANTMILGREKGRWTECPDCGQHLDGSGYIVFELESEKKLDVDEFEKLSGVFPEILFKIHYSETTCDTYGGYSFQNGIIEDGWSNVLERFDLKI